MTDRQKTNADCLEAVGVTRKSIGKKIGKVTTLYGQPGATAASIYAEAAAILENYPNVPDADLAISAAARHRTQRTRMLARMAFRDFFGCWINNDEGVLMLCFASAAAATGDLV